MSTSSARLFSQPDIEPYAARLREGGCLIYPTETLYGLGADALNAAAVGRIYQAKRRSATKPLPLIAAGTAMAARFVSLNHVPEALLSFWPGPLTLLLTALAPFPAPLVDKFGRVALRVSAHPAARALCAALGSPITATSANLSTRPAPASPEEIDPSLLAEIGCLADLPPRPSGGSPSTILAIEADGAVRAARWGSIDRSALEARCLRVLAD